jgi:hypothetical protein
VATASVGHDEESVAAGLFLHMWLRDFEPAAPRAMNV